MALGVLEWALGLPPPKIDDGPGDRPQKQPFQSKTAIVDADGPASGSVGGLENPGVARRISGPCPFGDETVTFPWWDENA